MDIVIKEKKLPTHPINLSEIKHFLYTISSMDTNNHPLKISIGEREGRCYSNLVAKRHYYFTHGIGRSGDLNENQPKAAGSTLLYKITNLLVNDFLSMLGFDGVQSILVPLSRKLTLLNCLLTFNSIEKNLKNVIYYGVDKKYLDFIESISNFKLVSYDKCLDQPLSEDLRSSCFLIDLEFIKKIKIKDILQNLKENELIPLILINFEFGFDLNEFLTIKNPHLIIYKDKYSILPVEASILCSCDSKSIEKFSKNYPGRATIKSTIDTFIKLLSKGKNELLNEKRINKVDQEIKNKYILSFNDLDDLISTETFLKKGFDGLQTRKNLFTNLSIHKKLPDVGWNQNLTQHCLKETENDELITITIKLIDDLLKTMGVLQSFQSLILPIATGMSLTLTLLTSRKLKPKANYVLWSRIDQKSCFKSILTAGLTPIIIDTKRTGSDRNDFVTDLNRFEEKIVEIGPENIVCIVSTTSCFAPRNSDDVESLSILCKKHELFHVVNNAYGLGSKVLMKTINRGKLKGNLDVFIQSTDKNLLIPVGGAIAVTFNPGFYNILKEILGKPPRFLIEDIFITLMEMGKKGWLKLVKDREFMYIELKEKLINLADKHGEKVVENSRNPISIAMTLKTINAKDLTRLGSSLFLKSVFGAKVITSDDNKTVCGFNFKGWGSHSNQCDYPYIVCAAALGVTEQDINGFISKLDEIMTNLKRNLKDK